ncbi:MAG: biotin carboxylase, partial [Myxococcota bacterium]
PGVTEEVALNFREKNRMKEVLRRAGVPVARQALLTGREDAARFVRQVGYPIVVKPPAGAGSVATMRVSSDAELVGALEKLFVSPSNPAQAEEFVQGEEHTFETVVIDGKPVWRSSSYYLPGPLTVIENPWMQYCVLLPRQMPEAAKQFRPTNDAALRALGLGTGLTHMEWFRRSDGSTVVSEVAARPPGVQLMPLMSHAHEVDMWAKWAELMVHNRWSVPERRWATGVAFFRGQGRGNTVREVHGLDAAQAAAGNCVVDRRLPVVGQSRASSYEGEGWAIVRAETTGRAVEALRALVSNVRVVLG